MNIRWYKPTGETDYKLQHLTKVDGPFFDGSYSMVWVDVHRVDQEIQERMQKINFDFNQSMKESFSNKITLNTAQPNCNKNS